MLKGVIPSDWIEKTTADGLLTLMLPAAWGQEDEEDDGTTAFGPDEEEDAGAGVLRVTPLVYEKDHDVTAKELPRLLAKRGPMPQRVTESRYVFHRIEEDEEDGEPLIQHAWEMVQQTGPREVVILMATYTLGTHETPKSAATLLAGLDASIRACTFDTSLEMEEDFDEEEDEEPEEDES